MATKKGYRSDNTYMFHNETGDNPKLGAKVLGDGRESIFLDYYLGYKKTYNEQTGKEGVKVNRKREYLHLYLFHNPKTPMERQSNKDTLELARKIKFEKGQQVLEGNTGYRLQKRVDVDFLEYFHTYLDNYTKKDKSVVKTAYHRFLDFLKDTPEYRRFADGLKPNMITKDMIMDFTDYLKSRSRGTGAQSIYTRFKKLVSCAVEHDMITKNPCAHISITADKETLTKDILSQDEMITLLTTHYDGENAQVQRAFTFCLYTGIRYCDVRELTYSNVDYSNKLLKFEQNKTAGHSGASGVVTPLNNEFLLRLIGTPKTDNPQELIFPLPCYSTCREHLQRWVDNAGINKHITWHCARHSFATNLLSNGANIKTVASLMGHSTIQYTQRYTRAVDALKQEAINSLPTPKL